jgi:hypothetical protein
MKELLWQHLSVTINICTCKELSIELSRKFEIPFLLLHWRSWNKSLAIFLTIHLHLPIYHAVRVRKMKEPGSYAEAKKVEQDGWAEDSDEETERNWWNVPYVLNM